MDNFIQLLELVPEIVEAILAVIGGLKVISRYTPWKWDDKLFGVVEKPVQWAKEKKRQHDEARAPKKGKPKKKPRKKRKRR